jgi:hypothetical protein
LEAFFVKFFINSRRANAHDVAHDAYGRVLTVTFDKAKYYVISFAKKALVGSAGQRSIAFPMIEYIGCHGLFFKLFRVLLVTAFLLHN